MNIGQLSIYACGGAASNIVSQLDVNDEQQEAGYSKPSITYIDSSRSNLRPDIPDSRIVLLEGTDGAGKVRRALASDFFRQKASMIQKHTPGDLSVVVFSASGGSGSTIGPMLISELISRKVSVVCLVIGSADSRISTENTLATLKSLEVITKQTGEPVIMCYHQNDGDTPRSAVDKACQTTLASLSFLASRQNAELDTADLSSWLRFHTTTTAEASLALLEIYTDISKASQPEQFVSVASLYNQTDNPPLPCSPDYHCAGYPRHHMEELNELHFAIRVGGMDRIVDPMRETIAEYDNIAQSRLKHRTFTDDKEVDSETGLVF